MLSKVLEMIKNFHQYLKYKDISRLMFVNKKFYNNMIPIFFQYYGLFRWDIAQKVPNHLKKFITQIYMKGFKITIEDLKLFPNLTDVCFHLFCSKHKRRVKITESHKNPFFQNYEEVIQFKWPNYITSCCLPYKFESFSIFKSDHPWKFISGNMVPEDNIQEIHLKCLTLSSEHFLIPNIDKITNLTLIVEDISMVQNLLDQLVHLKALTFKQGKNCANFIPTFPKSIEYLTMHFFYYNNPMQLDLPLGLKELFLWNHYPVDLTNLTCLKKLYLYHFHPETKLPPNINELNIGIFSEMVDYNYPPSLTDLTIRALNLKCLNLPITITRLTINASLIHDDFKFPCVVDKLCIQTPKNNNKLQCIHNEPIKCRKFDYDGDHFKFDWPMGIEVLTLNEIPKNINLPNSNIIKAKKIPENSDFLHIQKKRFKRVPKFF